MPASLCMSPCFRDTDYPVGWWWLSESRLVGCGSFLTAAKPPKITLVSRRSCSCCRCGRPGPWPKALGHLHWCVGQTAAGVSLELKVGYEVAAQVGRTSIPLVFLSPALCYQLRVAISPRLIDWPGLNVGNVLAIGDCNGLMRCRPQVLEDGWLPWTALASRASTVCRIYIILVLVFFLLFCFGVSLFTQRGLVLYKCFSVRPVASAISTALRRFLVAVALAYGASNCRLCNPRLRGILYCLPMVRQRLCRSSGETSAAPHAFPLDSLPRPP
jgi:hypothetical protein